VQALRNLPLFTLGYDEDEVCVRAVADCDSDYVKAILGDCLLL
jgi:hypothetical protein